MLLITYNASYGIYEVRDATTLAPIATTVFLSEAEYICQLGHVPERVIIH